MATVKLREPTEEEKDKIREAARNDNVHTLQELTSSGVDVTGSVDDNFNKTALHYAAQGGSNNVITFLLHHGAGVDDIHKRQWTPLHYAAEYGRTDSVALLVASGADINMKTSKQYTPLHKAASNGHTDIVALLVDSGADINMKNKFQSTPLHYAASNGHTDSVALLVASGADINMKGEINRTPVEEAVYNGRSATVYYFVKTLGMDITKIAEEYRQKASELVKEAEEELQEKRIKEIEETMSKARDAKYSVRIRYGKVLFCGAAAAGKSNFLSLIMKEDFQSLHISTEVLKPQQVAMKAVISSSDHEVEFTKMSIDEEILQLESYLPQPDHISDSSSEDEESYHHGSFSPELDHNSSTESLPITHTAYPENSSQPLSQYLTTNSGKFTLANINTREKKIEKKRPDEVWNILTFMDTGGQPQFISMLPAVNSFAMITFIIHKLQTGGQDSLKKIVKVQYGNEKGEISTPHPHKYTYLQLIETLISYASNILLPDATFLDMVKVESKKHENTRSLVLAGTHSGNDQISEDDIKIIDEELTKAVKKSGIDYIKPRLNKNYQYLVPVDNKKQSVKSELQVTEKDTKRYTDASDIRRHIQKFLNYQDEIHVPIKWLLLELEIRKVCQQKNCNLMSYDDVLKIAKEKQLEYNGEFGDDADVDGEQFIKQGLRFHHSFGVLLYFEDVEGMKTLVITNHQWLFNKLSRIVEYSFTCDTQAELKELKTGIFKTSFLDSDCLDIGKDFKDSQIDIKSVNPINAFLKLLEHLRIAAPSTEHATKYFMPCLLDSCELNDLEAKVPEYKANGIEPLLIQFKSTDNKTYSFPRGAFCFLVVELMLSMKWELYSQAYVNLITFFKPDTKHYVTLIDRIFCLEVHVKYTEDNSAHIEVREIINKALHTISKKLNIHCNLCYGFRCPCQLIKEMHISYITEDDDKHCCCGERSSTDITDSHTVWLKTYFKNNSSMKLHNTTALTGSRVVLSARDAIKHFNVKLVQQLPLDDVVFFTKAKQADLFPSNTGDSIKAKHTSADKASYFLQHVVEPGAEEYLPKLLKVMKESGFANVVRLADDIQAATDLGSQPVRVHQQQLSGYYQAQSVASHQPQLAGYYQTPPAGVHQPQSVGHYQQQPPGTNQPQPAGYYQQQPTGVNQPQSAGLYQQQPAVVYQQQPVGYYSQQPAGVLQQQPSGNYQQQPAGVHQPQPADYHHQQLARVHQPQPAEVPQSQPAGLHWQQPTGLQQPQPAGVYQSQLAGVHQPQPAGYYQQQLARVHQPQPTEVPQSQPAGLHRQQPTGLQQPQPAEVYQSQLAGVHQPQPAGVHQSMSLDNRNPSVIKDDDITTTTIPPDSLTKDESSTFPHTPQPKRKKP